MEDLEYFVMIYVKLDFDFVIKMNSSNLNNEMEKGMKAKS